MVPLREKALTLQRCELRVQKDNDYESWRSIIWGGSGGSSCLGLIKNAEADKKMYLDGIPNLNDSPVTKYLNDRNKIIISAEEIEINK
jgi:hypothetical protein